MSLIVALKFVKMHKEDNQTEPKAKKKFAKEYHKILSGILHKFLVIFFLILPHLLHCRKKQELIKVFRAINLEGSRSPLHRKTLL